MTQKKLIEIATEWEKRENQLQNQKILLKKNENEMKKMDSILEKWERSSSEKSSEVEENKGSIEGQELVLN